MHHFFVQTDQIHQEQGMIYISGTDVNHIKNVLRMKQGEELLISGGDNQEYECTIRTLDSEEILLDIQEVHQGDKELPSKIYLFQGLPKSDKMELIIQKAVELGVYEIIPVETRRCVVKLDKKKEESKHKRWQGIAESAAKQSKRMIIPQVTHVMKLSQAIEKAKELDICLIPYELAEDMEHTRTLLQNIQPGQSIGFFVGPEGGFDTEEVEQAFAEHIEPITLGKRILRTETAGMTMLSILMYLLEGR